MFLDPEDPGSIPGEEHGKIGGALCYEVSSKAHGQGLQVVLSKKKKKKNYYEWAQQGTYTGSDVAQDKKVRAASFGPGGGQ